MTAHDLHDEFNKLVNTGTLSLTDNECNLLFKASIPLEVKCSTCGEIWSTYARNIVSKGCPICRKFERLKKQEFKSEIKRRTRLEGYAKLHNIPYAYEKFYSTVYNNQWLKTYASTEQFPFIQHILNDLYMRAKSNNININLNILQGLAAYVYFRRNNKYITNKIAAKIGHTSERSIEHAKEKLAPELFKTYPEFRRPDKIKGCFDCKNFDSYECPNCDPSKPEDSKWVQGEKVEP